MKKEIADKWIEALLSGKYTQSSGCLKIDNGHCCLGVLSELYVEAEVVSPGVATDILDGAYLTLSVAEWAGMHSTMGTFRDSNLADLAILNDNKTSFAQIAEIIRNNYELL